MTLTRGRVTGIPAGGLKSELSAQCGPEITKNFMAKNPPSRAQKKSALPGADFFIAISPTRPTGPTCPIFGDTKPGRDGSVSCAGSVGEEEVGGYDGGDGSHHIGE